MLLGKRPRPPPPIRRTTSMTGLTSTVDPVDPNHQMMTMPDHHDHQGHGYDPDSMMTPTSSNNYGFVNDNNSYYDDHGRFLASMVLSPRNVHQHQRSSSSGAYVIEPPNFLRTCGLCRRRLASGRDIYMYRGDTAFCSQECREKRMKQDERKEKNSEVVMATKREEHQQHK